jgi:hypothetical protein
MSGNFLSGFFREAIEVGSSEEALAKKRGSHGN